MSFLKVHKYLVDIHLYVYMKRSFAKCDKRHSKTGLLMPMRCSEIVFLGRAFRKYVNIYMYEELFCKNTIYKLDIDIETFFFNST